MAGWRLPGQRSDPGSWVYSSAKGWLPPGMEGDEQGTEYEMGQDFDPSQRDAGWHTIISPPGVAAPKDGINYTPQTQEVHAGGYQAPIQHENLTIMPAAFPNPKAGGYTSVGAGQAAPTQPGAAPPGLADVPWENHPDMSPVIGPDGKAIPGLVWVQNHPFKLPTEANPQNWQLVGPLDDGSFVQVNPDTGETRPVQGLHKSPTQGQGTWSPPRLAPDGKTYITDNSQTGEIRNAATGAVIRGPLNSPQGGAAPGGAAPAGTYKEGPSLTGSPLEAKAREVARKYGVSPDVFAKQIQQESGFNPEALSPAGAKGIAQFMPGTAVEAAKLIGVTPDQFWADPALQLQGSAALMSKYLTKYNGSYQLALIAYNAGEGAADAYHSGAKPNLYDETRHYLDIILGPGHPQPNTAGLANDPTGGSSGGPVTAGGAAGTTDVFTPGPDWDIVDTPAGKVAVNKKDPSQVVRIPGTAGIKTSVVGTRLVGMDPLTNETSDLYKAPNMSVEQHGRYVLLVNHDTGETNVIQADPSMPTTGPGGHGMLIPSDVNLDVQKYGRYGKERGVEHIAATQPVGWDLPQGTKWGQLTPDQLAQFGPQKSTLNVEAPPGTSLPKSAATVGQAPITLPGGGAPPPSASALPGAGAPPAKVASGLDAAAEQTDSVFSPPTDDPSRSTYGPFDPPGYAPAPVQYTNPQGPALPGSSFETTNDEGFPPGHEGAGEMVWDPEKKEWVVPSTPTNVLQGHPITDNADRMLGMGQADPMMGNTGVDSGWQPPLDPSTVVGDGNKFGDQVSMEGIHHGTDLQAYEGTPVYSPVDGTVVAVDNDPQGLGIQVHIQGVDGTVHTVAHLLQPDVQMGDQVTAGQPVGKVGQSGAGATGPHLDYRQQTPDGQYINPEPQLGALAQMPPSPDTIGEDGQRLGSGQDAGVPDGWPPGFRLPSGADPWDRSRWTEADFAAYQQALRAVPMPQGLGFDQPYSDQSELPQDQSSATPAMSADTAFPQGAPVPPTQYNDRWTRPDMSAEHPDQGSMGDAWQVEQPQLAQGANTLQQSYTPGETPGENGEGAPYENYPPVMHPDNERYLPAGGHRNPDAGGVNYPEYGEASGAWPVNDMNPPNGWPTVPEPLGGMKKYIPQWPVLNSSEVDPQLAQLLAGLAAAGAGGAAVGGRLAGGLGNAAAGVAGMLPRGLFDPSQMYGQEVGQGQSHTSVEVGYGQDEPYVGMGQSALHHQDNGDGTVTEWYDDGSSITWNIDSGDLVSQEPAGTWSGGDQPPSDGGGGSGDGGSGDGSGDGGSSGGGGGAPRTDPNSNKYRGADGNLWPDFNTYKMFTDTWGMKFGHDRWDWENDGSPGGEVAWQRKITNWGGNPNQPGNGGSYTPQNPNPKPVDPGTDPGPPAPGTTPPPNPEVSLKLTEYEQHYLDQQQQKIDIDKQHQQLLDLQETNRHNEAIRSAHTQEDINAENNRHNQVMEQLNYYKTNTDAQQAELSRQNDLRMKGSFAQQQQADLLKTALNNPWLQNLSGMAPAFGAAGWNPDSPSVLNDLLRGWEPQANVLPSTTNPSPWGQQAGANFPTPGTSPQDNTPTPPTQPGLPQNPGGSAPPPPASPPPGGGVPLPPGGGTTPPPVVPPGGGGPSEGPGGGQVPGPVPPPTGGGTPPPPTAPPPGGGTTVPPIPTTPGPAPVGWQPPTNPGPTPPPFNHPEGSGPAPQTNVPPQQPGPGDPTTMFMSNGNPKTAYLAKRYIITVNDSPQQVAWKQQQNKLVEQYNHQLILAGRQYALTGNAGTLPVNPTSQAAPPSGGITAAAAPVRPQTSVPSSPFAAPQGGSNTSVGAAPAGASPFGSTPAGASPFAAPTTTPPVTSVPPVRQPTTPSVRPVRDAKAAANVAKAAQKAVDKPKKIQDMVMV